jgi:hypothetical protein
MNYNETNTSKVDLSKIEHFIYEIGYMYIIPIISLIGVTLNGICLLILLSSKLLKATIYNYFILKTFCELLMCILGVTMPVYVCQDCLFSSTLVVVAYWLYVFLIVNPIAFTVSMLCEILITYDRVMLFKTGRHLSSAHLKFKHAAMFAVAYSIFISIPRLFAQTISEIVDRPGKYHLQETIFGMSSLYKYYLIAIDINSSLFWMSILIALNLLVLFKFRAYKLRRASLVSQSSISSIAARMNNLQPQVRGDVELSLNNSQMASSLRSHQKEEQSERSLAFSILCCCFIYSLNRFLLSIADILAQLDSLGNNYNRQFITIINFIARLICYLTFSMNFFILILFNKTFKSYLIELIKRHLNESMFLRVGVVEKRK